MRHRWILLLTLSAVLMSLLGCNTWRGFGKDIETFGQSMQKQPAPQEDD